MTVYSRFTTTLEFSENEDFSPNLAVLGGSAAEPELTQMVENKYGLAGGIEIADKQAFTTDTGVLLFVVKNLSTVTLYVGSTEYTPSTLFTLEPGDVTIFRPTESTETYGIWGGSSVAWPYQVMAWK